MRKLATVFVSLVLTLSLLPAVLSTDIGSGVGIDMETEKFAPLVWMCDHRIVYDDLVEPGRIDCGDHCGCESFSGDKFGGDKCKLVERIENYAFEGEQIEWLTLVMDKNGVEKVKDVYVTIGSSQGEGNDIEANCRLITEPRLECCEGKYCHDEKECLKEHKYDTLATVPTDKWWRGPGCYVRGDSRANDLVVEVEKNPKFVGDPECIPDSCNARILEEKLDEFEPSTMAFYDCLFTVETPLSMQNEYWFLNPTIALEIMGAIDFGTVRPGTVSYSDTLTVGNGAEESSGVLLDMFIAGTDFYDPMSSGAKCPTTNQLSLDQFKYFASNGAYSTQGKNCADPEGYSYIPHGIKITDAKEIIGCSHYGSDDFYEPGNVLTPGAEMSLTFKLKLPEPCNGDFSDGTISFWGEAV